MSRLVLTESLWGELDHAMRESRNETCAVLWGTHVNGAAGGRFVVRQFEVVPASSYTLRSPVRAQLSAEYIGQLCNEARRRRESIVFVHSHPEFAPVYSGTDDAGEQELAALFRLRTPELTHATMIHSPFGCVARLLAGPALAVFAVGTRLRPLGPELTDTGGVAVTGRDEHYDRQARAFGRAGQRMLRQVQVGIVGAGGTGSVAALQLAYLGVRGLTIIDDDRVDASNLNRLVGATRASVGQPKAEVVADHVRAVRDELRVQVMTGRFPSGPTVAALLDCDVVFCCTDSEGSRHVLNELAYQYLLPVIDLGTEIDPARSPMVLQVRTQLLAPGMPCHTCTNFLDGNQVRWDLQSETVRKADPYFRGGGDPAPSVISLNSTAVSLAVNIFIALVTGSPSPRAVKGDMATGHFKAFTADIEPNCVTCSPARGRLARGTGLPVTGVRHD